MTITEVSDAIGEKVIYNGKEHVLTACIKRRDAKGSIYFQAEVVDKRTNTAYICRPGDLVMGKEEGK